MKKIIVLVLSLILIAAGCDSASQETVPVQQRQDASPQPAPVITPIPKVTPVPEAKKPSSDCDPNYSGCVPVASDVDCAGGSGNGPAYVRGPINVIGSDIYDLDRDGNGIACE